MFGMMDANQARQHMQRRMEGVERALAEREAIGAHASAWSGLARALRGQGPRAAAAPHSARPVALAADDQRTRSEALGV